MSGDNRELRIDYVRLDEIKPDPDNPKDHDLGALAQSLERFGFVAPMGINEVTGYLLWGHGRWEELVSLRRLGSAVPDGIKVADDGMWLAPVVRGIHLPEPEGTAYVITDNRQVELGGWNEQQLIKTLIRVNRDSGLEGTGYDGDDLDALIVVHGNPPDLDELEDKWGDPDDEEFWPLIRLKVAPDTYEHYVQLIAGYPGKSEGEQFGELLKDINPA